MLYIQILKCVSVISKNHYTLTLTCHSDLHFIFGITYLGIINRTHWKWLLSIHIFSCIIKVIVLNTYLQTIFNSFLNILRRRPALSFPDTFCLGTATLWKQIICRILGSVNQSNHTKQGWYYCLSPILGTIISIIFACILWHQYSLFILIYN